MCTELGFESDQNKGALYPKQQPTRMISMGLCVQICTCTRKQFGRRCVLLQLFAFVLDMVMLANRWPGIVSADPN